MKNFLEKKMLPTLVIKIQSISDVITNSSTEIYTICSEHTLDRLKEIVNSILKITDSTLTADDLFIFELEEESEDRYGCYYDRGYKVIPKKENYTEAAKCLSNIMNIFEQEACYNG